MATTASGIWYPAQDGSGPVKVPLDMKTMADSIEAIAGGSRKAVEIATEQTRVTSTFGYLTTPDQVTGVVVPAKSFVRLYYQALWSLAAGTAQAAIFIGANQLKIAENAGAPQTQAAQRFATGNAAVFSYVTSFWAGLLSPDNSGATASEVTTGQVIGTFGTAYSTVINNTVRTIGTGAWGATSATGANMPIGGPCCVFVAPGTYTIGVQFKGDGTNTMQVKNRRLYVEVVKFP